MKGSAYGQPMHGKSSGVVAMVACACTLLLAQADLGARETEHPTLVSVEEAVCTTCHEDLLDDRAFVHAVALDDCTTCHEVSVAENGTSVKLMESEPALCLMCHDDLSAAVEGELSAPHFPVADSCMTCHDPHATDHPSLTLSAVPDLCADCHDTVDLESSHGGQLTPATNCVGCHLPHGSNNETMLAGSRRHAPFADGSCNGCHRDPFGNRIRLRTRGERLCEACHGSFVDDSVETQVVHEALEGVGGKAGCLSCHDPHMSTQPALLTRSESLVCRPCHEDVVDAANAKSGHAPAAESCVYCHQPHVSEVPSLLLAPPIETCEMCHDVTDEELAGSHLGADLSQLDCLGCHDPHGTGNPSLLARNLHAPMLNGCDTCHEESHDSLVSDGDSSLCLICHDDIGDLAEGAPVPHAALEMARCADCHNPHASAQASLVKSPDGAICAGCHSEQAATDGEVAHRVIEVIGCEACHEPHGSDNPKLLRLGGDQLCLSCHDPRTIEVPRDDSETLVLGRFRMSAIDVRAMATLRLSEDRQQGHPIARHRVAGQPTREELKRTDTTFKDEMTCLTCHDPHKGQSREILRWDASRSMDACMHCHPK